MGRHSPIPRRCVLAAASDPRWPKHDSLPRPAQHLAKSPATADPVLLTWADLDRMNQNLADAEREQLKTVFQAVGFNVAEAMRAAGAWAAGAQSRDIDFR